MCVKSDQAVDLYNKACRSEQAGEAKLAEIYYLKSGSLFEQAGSSYCLKAADTLNALAFLRWSYKDYEGALRSARESIRIMETYGSDYSNADAELIHNTSWELIDQVAYELSLASRMR